MLVFSQITDVTKWHTDLTDTTDFTLIFSFVIQKETKKESF